MDQINMDHTNMDNTSVDPAALAAPPPETTLQYWSRVVGNDLVRMLMAARCQEPAIQCFMEYFINQIPQAWCFKSSQSRIDPEQPLPTLNSDKSPIETGFNISAKNTNPAVRLLAEVDHTSAKNALDWYCRRNRWGPVVYAMPWVNSLYRSLMRGLKDGSCFFGDVRVAFDIRHTLRRHSVVGRPVPIPADTRAYFVATIMAQHEGITRWEMIRRSILGLPDVQSEAPEVVSGVGMVDDFLAGYPPEAGDLMFTVDVEPVDPRNARVGFSCTVPAGETAPDFKEVWKWLTLGGRITALKNDKALFQTFFDLVHGVDSKEAAGEPMVIDSESSADSDSSVESDSSVDSDRSIDLDSYIDRAETSTAPPQVAACSIDFSVRGGVSEPRATLRLETKYNSRTDIETAEGIEAFLLSQEFWVPLPGPYPELVLHCFPGIPLDRREDKVHSSVSLGRQGKYNDEWVLQTGYNPLYYDYARP